MEENKKKTLDDFANIIGLILFGSKKSVLEIIDYISKFTHYYYMRKEIEKDPFLGKSIHEIFDEFYLISRLYNESFQMNNIANDNIYKVQ